ncbi:MAG: hypothetical protein ABI435_01285 [Pseudolysinimonas sp.]
MIVNDWEATWILDVTFSEDPEQLPQKVVITYNGTTAIPDVTMPIVFDEQGHSGEDHRVPVTVEPGMRFEVRHFLQDVPVWLQIVEGLSRGDASQTVLALFPSPFKKTSAS